MTDDNLKTEMTMKKIMMMTLTALLVISLSACAQTNKTKENKENENIGSLCRPEGNLSCRELERGETAQQSFEEGIGKLAQRTALMRKLIACEEGKR